MISHIKEDSLIINGGIYFQVSSCYFIQGREEDGVEDKLQSSFVLLIKSIF